MAVGEMYAYAKRRSTGNFRIRGRMYFRVERLFSWEPILKGLLRLTQPSVKQATDIQISLPFKAPQLSAPILGMATKRVRKG
jgi:hypothetical protein